MKLRVEELRRQRELIREHLRWIENEIAAATVSEPVNDPAGTAGPAPPLVAPFQDPMAANLTSPATLEALPGPDVDGLQSEVRTGCLIYAVILFGSLALLVGFIYWKY